MFIIVPIVKTFIPRKIWVDFSFIPWNMWVDILLF